MLSTTSTLKARFGDLTPVNQIRRPQVAHKRGALVLAIKTGKEFLALLHRRVVHVPLNNHYWRFDAVNEKDRTVKEKRHNYTGPATRPNSPIRDNQRQRRSETGNSQNHNCSLRPPLNFTS